MRWAGEKIVLKHFHKSFYESVVELGKYVRSRLYRLNT